MRWRARSGPALPEMLLRPFIKVCLLGGRERERERETKTSEPSDSSVVSFAGPGSPKLAFVSRRGHQKTKHKPATLSLLLKLSLPLSRSHAHVYALCTSVIVSLAPVLGAAKVLSALLDAR
eukprot:scaffold5113_cov364-Pinguiococcus_pyrenoidosus.AAC.10